MKIAISGASGKTGSRIAEEAIASGNRVRLLLRKGSFLPNTLSGQEKTVISLNDSISIEKSLDGCDALIIATGARPSIDLTGPARVDAFGVKQQVLSCQRSGIKRILLVSSLCAGRWIHPLNLFGLILVWKRIGEKALEESGLDWTVIRPGGLNEEEEELETQGIRYTAADFQQDAYIPRRLLAKCCIEALQTPESKNKIIEVTSSKEQPSITMKQALKDIAI